MTWYEEWFLYFEFVYGKTVHTVEAAMAAYGMKGDKAVNKVIDTKLDMILRARQQWPKYASLIEDEFLRNTKWNQKYKGKRVVFWDNTGIVLHKPSQSLLQRITYSSYYAGNVAKGGIFIQLCGWLGTHELFTGAMSDSEYMNTTNILEEQEIFQESDGGTKFTNVLDRGYRSTQAAWRAGGQFIHQPTFAKSDAKFSTIDTLSAASVAADRSGNERAVRVAKMSSYVKSGTTKHKNTVRLADVWLAWSWQANFMFKPVL